MVNLVVVTEQTSSASVKRVSRGDFTMSDVKAIVREHVERIDGVTRTWFEWSHEGGAWVKTLVVEVGFDTDPNSPEYQGNVLDAVENTARDVLRNETTMVVTPKNHTANQLMDLTAGSSPAFWGYGRHIRLPSQFSDFKVFCPIKRGFQRLATRF